MCVYIIKTCSCFLVVADSAGETTKGNAGETTKRDNAFQSHAQRTTKLVMSV